MCALLRMAPSLTIRKPRNMLSPASFAGTMPDPDNQAKVFAGGKGPVKRDQLNTPEPMRIRQALLRRASSL